jgi:hypothetical protein
MGMMVSKSGTEINFNFFYGGKKNKSHFSIKFIYYFIGGFIEVIKMSPHCYTSQTHNVDMERCGGVLSL